jgi:hypothetical protein
MTVALDTTTVLAGGESSTFPASNTTITATSNMTLGSGANALLALLGGYNASGNLNNSTASMLFNGNALTSLTSIQDSTSNNQILYLFGAIGSTVTGNTGSSFVLSGTYGNPASGVIEAVVAGISFTGVSQVSLAAAFANLTSAGPTTSTTPSITVPSAAGNMAVAFGSNANFNTSWTAGAGSPNTVTEFLNQVGNIDISAEAQYSNGTSSQTFNATMGASQPWVMLGVNVVASAPPAGGPGRIMTMGVGWTAPAMAWRAAKAIEQNPITLRRRLLGSLWRGGK